MQILTVNRQVKHTKPTKIVGNSLELATDREEGRKCIFCIIYIFMHFLFIFNNC